MVEQRNHFWEKKKGEDWWMLGIDDLNSLTLDQSLKVQEMFDNKYNQHLQQKVNETISYFNLWIIFLTLFVALGAFFNLIILLAEYLEVSQGGFKLIISFFVILFFIMAVVFFVYSKKDKTNTKQ